MVVPAVSSALRPGGTIGVLGGGQLGRMIAISAAQLGYRTHIFCQHEDDPAAQVAGIVTIAPYDDKGAIDRFAQNCDVVTLEFENIPTWVVNQIAQIRPMRPGSRVLEVAQDRVREKDFINWLDIETAAYRSVDSKAELHAAHLALGGRMVVKTRRLGYDGKGQKWIEHSGEISEAWKQLAGAPSIAEAAVDFTAEISVIAARGIDGAVAAYVPVENRHIDGILDRTIAPALIDDTLADKAVAIAEKIVTALDLVGVLAVEMFVTEGGRLLVNEIAPRPHNSGHWTIDACAVSQFEQVVRAVAGLPLGNPARHSDADMRNLIGGDADKWAEFVSEPGACLHLYGKNETRPGRKMGHVTYLKRVSERGRG